MAVAGAASQVAADRIANLGRVAWAWQDMAVAVPLAGAVMQLAVDGIAKLDRKAQVIVVECSVRVDRAGVEDKNLELPAEVSLQNLSYAPGNLALQYYYLKHLSAF